jgi:hypothetical protein
MTDDRKEQRAWSRGHGAGRQKFRDPKTEVRGQKSKKLRSLEDEKIRGNGA